ncbi:MAG: pseudouridylate synthase [Polyangiaceae bacterium]|nr:pseudouridylate synthase [Polyangiaceae bacterium]
MDVLLLAPRFVVVAKPSGLLVHRGWGEDPVTALELVRDRVGRRVYPVHRLDRATSGALIFALDPDAARALHERIEAGEVEKRYLALVRGVPPGEGVIDHPIPRREGGPRVPAVTAFRRLHAGEAYSLVEARPRTGRLHQVRRHMKHISHPLLGDANYGKGALNRLYRERFGLARLALHAAEIAFIDPWTGAPARVAAPLPLDLRAPFERMGVPEAAWAAPS